MGRAPAPAGNPPAVTGGMPDTASTDEQEPVRNSSGGISILALIVLTLFAGGLGGGFGVLATSALLEGMVTDKVLRDASPKNDKLNMFVLPLPPITTNLAGASRVWMRLEASIVAPADLGEETTAIIGQVSEDIIAYIRSLSPDQLDGPSGFEHLREDLNDRVRTRTNGKVSGIIIQALIIE